ncbi:hypothetical protein PRUPE_1G011100 [Prunus persica]|uniref:Uncharacterized protein n=1 Tax=Prunus persica TaxID=3760 RepID=A0A251QR33_PRUPE|nr:hypothetical protein PRUPE_1G011100 [Prunus persica]
MRCACGLELIALDKMFNEEKCFPSTSKRSSSRREYFSWLVKPWSSFFEERKSKCFYG